MEHRALGRSGLEVSRIILGCGNFGGIGSAPAFFGAGETESEAHALMDAAWEAGIRTFDTADAYGGGRSESFIGSWLGSKGAEVREQIVLATKTFNPMADGEDSGLSRGRIRRQLDGSLTRLGLEAVLSTSPTRWIRTCRSPRRSERSTSSSTRARSRRTAAATSTPPGSRKHGDTGVPTGPRTPTRCCNERTSRKVMMICVREGLGYTPFSPLAGGWLTGKYRRGEDPPAGSRMTLRPDAYLHFQDDRVFDALEAFEELALERRTSPAALAIAWLLGDPNVTAVVVGPRRPEQLRPALEALDLQLSPSEREQLAALFA